MKEQNFLNFNIMTNLVAIRLIAIIYIVYGPLVERLLPLVKIRYWVLTR